LIRRPATVKIGAFRLPATDNQITFRRLFKPRKLSVFGKVHAMRAIAGSILVLAAVQFHRSPAASGLLGFCLLWIIGLAGAGYLASDFADQRRSLHARVWLGRFSVWLLSGRNYLIKGTVFGAIIGLLANPVLFGSSQAGKLAAIPGAMIGLLLGVALDAAAHRYQHRRPAEPSESAAAIEADDPLAPDPLAPDPLADERPPLVESHGWGLSLGISHAIPDWPKGSNPIER